MPIAEEAEGAARTCRVCGSGSPKPFYAARGVPVHVGLQWPDADAARGCPRGDMDLVWCDQCGFIANAAFDESLMAYEGRYENALHFSPLFREYADGLVAHLVDAYDLRGKSVLEIGCGDGEFLRLLCAKGGNTGNGFDPSLDATALPESDGRVIFHARPFGRDDAALRADIVCCRQVLEHIEQPVRFIEEIRDTLEASDPLFFFEVPDTMRAIEQLSLWDFIYEHCACFGPASLSRAFTRAGFEVLAVPSLYKGIFVGVEARRGAGATSDPGVTEAEAAAVDHFSRAARRRVDAWSERLAAMKSDGKRVVLWGAGARGVMFASMVDAADAIDVAVDLNPRKHGLYLAGGGQAIVPPDHLVDAPPDVVILTNGIYRDEIGGSLAAMGMHPEILVAQGSEDP